MGKDFRVVQINSNYGKSGAGKIVKALHEYYLLNNIDSYVAYGRDHIACDDTHVYKIGNKINVYIHALLSRVLGLNGYASIIATKKLTRYLDTISPDIVHLHGIHGYYLNYSILFSYLSSKGISVLWTFHDCQAFTGKCGYHYECDKYRSLCGKCPYLSDYPASYLFDFTKKMFVDKKNSFLSVKNMTIVTPSNWLTRDVDNSIFKDVRHITINNGIDNINTFYPNKTNDLKIRYGFDDEKKIVLGVAYGFKNPRKGFEYLKQLAIDRPQYQFVFAGADIEMISGLDNVKCVPFISDQNVLRDYYSLADVLVMPSLSENYATVGLEALSCGTPIACFNVGGNLEVIKNGKFGIAVEKENGKELAAAVDKLLCMKFDREEIHQIMINENSVKTMAEKYISEYRQLIGMS